MTGESYIPARSAPPRTPSEGSRRPLRSRDTGGGRLGGAAPTGPRTFDQIEAEARSAEAAGDIFLAADKWSAARETAPESATAACHEIELLVTLKRFELAHLRVLTALQRFSNEQPQLSALKKAIEDRVRWYYKNIADNALQSHDREICSYYYQLVAILEPVEKYRWYYFDMSQEISIHFPRLLAFIDGDCPRQRIYIMGCGRSGTTLLTVLMQCFRDIYVLPDEVPAGRFARIFAPEGTHVLKRHWSALATIDLLPTSIHLLFIIRCPFDLLVSVYRNKEYVIKPERWVQEIVTLRRLIETGRINLKVVRYEDLVDDPDRMQAEIADYYDLAPMRPFSEFHRHAAVTDEIADWMHGIRPPDRNSIGRWRSDPRHIAYCRSIWPEIADDARWLCRKFGYDLPTEICGETAAVSSEETVRHRGD